MARFDSLMKEDRYLEAEETVLVAEQESKKTAILADPAITGASLNAHTKMMHDEYNDDFKKHCILALIF